MAQEMLQKGYLPADQFAGIMSLNRELREQHKRLLAELVSLRVEQERLRMEEGFLRDSMVQAGLTLPTEVPTSSSAASSPRRPSTAGDAGALVSASAVGRSVDVAGRTTSSGADGVVEPLIGAAEGGCESERLRRVATAPAGAPPGAGRRRPL